MISRDSRSASVPTVVSISFFCSSLSRSHLLSSVVTNPFTPVSGERNSWATVATRSERSRSSRSRPRADRSTSATWSTRCRCRPVQPRASTSTSVPSGSSQDCSGMPVRRREPGVGLVHGAPVAGLLVLQASAASASVLPTLHGRPQHPAGPRVDHLDHARRHRRSPPRRAGVRDRRATSSRARQSMRSAREPTRVDPPSGSGPAACRLGDDVLEPDRSGRCGSPRRSRFQRTPARSGRRPAAAAHVGHDQPGTDQGQDRPEHRPQRLAGHRAAAEPAEALGVHTSPTRTSPRPSGSSHADLTTPSSWPLRADGVEAHRRRGGQVQALGPAQDRDRDPVVGERGELGGQPPGLVAEQPGDLAASRSPARTGRPRRPPSAARTR